MYFFKQTIVIMAVAMLSAVPIAAAETVVRTGDKVSLGNDQSVAGDFYAVAGPISLSGEITGDAHIAGSSITTNGTIGADLFAAGGSVQVHASVTDDVRVIAGEVTIAEYVGGDLFVIGGILTLLSTAEVEGDVFFYGGEAEINGTVNGSVHGISEAVRINGPIGGGVDVRTYDLEIGDRADIAGDVRYQSSRELTRAQNAVVVGSIVRNDVPTESPDARQMLIPFLMYAFSALILLAVFRERLEKLLIRAKNQFTVNGIIGLSATIFLPVAIALTLATVIGSFIGFIALFMTIALLGVSFLLAGTYMGLLLNTYFAKKPRVSLLSTLSGIVTLFIIVAIPIIGPAVVFVFTVVVFGTILRRAYEAIV